MDPWELIYYEHEYDLLNWNDLIIPLDNDEDLHLSSGPTKNIELGIENYPCSVSNFNKMDFYHFNS